MYNLIRIGALCGISLFLACTSADTKNPQVGGGILDETETIASGTIVDSQNNPVPQCSLWLRSTTPFTETTLVTDPLGKFSFKHIHPGNYVLMAHAGKINQGLQVRFTLEQGDSMAWTQPLTMQKLTFLTITREQAGNADSVWVPELGKYFAVPSSIPSVPAGSYTIMPLGPDSATDPIIIPAGTSDSLSSSVYVSSSSQMLSSQNTPNASSSSTLFSSSAVSITSSNGENTFVWNTSSGSLGDARDGQTYAILAFDSLYWFAQNLRYNQSGSTCNPNDTYAKTGECFEFGRYYNHDQALTACPSGWRLPSIEEWQTVLLVAGGYAIAGLQLKSPTYWNAIAGTDNLGFSILPAGTSSAPTIGNEAFFWTSTEAEADFYYTINASSTGSSILTTSIQATEGMSVRCVMNKN